MDVFGNLTLENVIAFETYFLTGFVFRSVERGIRGAPKEEEIRTVVLAVIWSLILSAILPLVSRPQPLWLDVKWRIPLSMASIILFAAIAGLLWSALRPLILGVGEWTRNKLKAKLSWLQPVLEPELHSRTREQCAVRFLNDAGTNRVRVTLKSGKRYSGAIESYDSSAEPDSPGYLVLAHLYTLGSAWEQMPMSKMLIRMDEIEEISIQNT